MARIRTIKPEFWVDDVMVELSFAERLLFIGLWNFADDDGYIENKPKRIKMQIFPADNILIEDSLSALVNAGRVEIVQSDQGELLRITNWERHQSISRKTKTRFTGIAGNTVENEAHSRSPHGVLTESSVNSTESSLTEKEKEREKEKEVNSETKVSSLSEKTKNRGTRIEKDFTPSPDTLTWAKENLTGFDYRTEHDNFIDYWTATPGARGTKLDWDATWRTWMRRASQQAPRSQLRSPKTEAENILLLGQRMQASQDRKEIMA